MKALDQTIATTWDLILLTFWKQYKWKVSRYGTWGNTPEIDWNFWYLEEDHFLSANVSFWWDGDVSREILVVNNFVLDPARLWLGAPDEIVTRQGTAGCLCVALIKLDRQNLRAKFRAVCGYWYSDTHLKFGGLYSKDLWNWKQSFLFSFQGLCWLHIEPLSVSKFSIIESQWGENFLERFILRRPFSQDESVHIRYSFHWTTMTLWCDHQPPNNLVDHRPENLHLILRTVVGSFEEPQGVDWCIEFAVDGLKSQELMMG